MTSAEPPRSVRDHLSEVIDRVGHQHERVIITRNGRDAGRGRQPGGSRRTRGTSAVLSDPQVLADIREADAAYARGDVVRGIDAVHRLAR